MSLNFNIIAFKDAEGDVSVHALAVGEASHSLCGEFPDPSDNFEEMEVSVHRRINCPRCYEIWKYCMQLNSGSFSRALTKPASGKQSKP